MPSGADVTARAEFESLTRPLLTSLYRFALHSLRQRHDAEELVQEACLAAYRAFDRFARAPTFAPGSSESWRTPSLIGIAGRRGALWSFSSRRSRPNWAHYRPSPTAVG